MSRLLFLSPGFLCSRCRYCPPKTGCFSSVLRFGLKSESQLSAGRALQRRHLTGARRSFQSFNGAQPKFWILGVGAGFLLALGLKNHYSPERCECESENKEESHSDITSKYSAAVEISRDLVQRIKVQVPGQAQFCASFP